ncbi:hypothetical protein LC040_11050 [Bacillus tianshenii]|nr:hypothetical protein LC040_11050 [Bacillus tianshenii]
MMEWAIIGLFSVAIILLILSFFKDDKLTELENQVDQLSMTMIKEHYQIKKKLKVFEEELILNEQPLTVEKQPVKPPYTAIDRSEMTDQEEVLFLYDAGLTYEQIAQETGQPYDQVQLIIEHIAKRGR